MKKILLTASLTLVTLAAQAEKIYCDYTEPFYTVEYDTKAKTITALDYSGDEVSKTTKSYSNMNVVELAPLKVNELESYSRFAIKTDNKTLTILILDYKGSNGMSDLLYPYTTGSDKNLTGCFSEKLKPLMPAIEGSLIK